MGEFIENELRGSLELSEWIIRDSFGDITFKNMKEF